MSTTRKTRGLFISFDGPDGAGKTTSLNATYERLIKQGYKVVKTREPGGTPVSEEIRNIILQQYCVPRCEMLLFAAARAQHVEQMIKPALEAGYIVLCDRFSMSSYAYQQVARGLGPDVTMLDTFARNGAWPDFVVYFDVEVEEGIRRLNARAEANGKSDRIDKESIEFKKKVNAGFKQAYDERVFKNVYRVDANMAPIYVDMQVNSWLEWDVIPCHTGENMPMFGYPDRPDLSRFVQEWIDQSNALSVQG